MASIHDYTSNSPLKSFTLKYDHERQRQLEEIAERNYEPYVLVRDPRQQMENSKKVTMDAQKANATQSLLHLNNQKYLKKQEKE